MGALSLVCLESILQAPGEDECGREVAGSR